ncbi:preprotein translocase subunit SecE [uncultured Megasphaera sp.]|uniref:preprotein translocase subunit SecE n=1 Tax=uncultured Megasphaera sp. TaxID=165188 RepID=UPI0026598908|nr:preprotein translocase subunit SecE [uncultured Megasphaera sp.]
MALSAKKAAQKNKKNPGKSFLQGVKVEMKKVIWPTKRELINYTIMVVVATIVVMAIIGVADGVFSQLFNLLRAAVG